MLRTKVTKLTMMVLNTSILLHSVSNIVRGHGTECSNEGILLALEMN